MAQKKVLIVDESDLFRDYLGDRLSSYGVVVDSAINGLDGMVKMRNGMPDLVILDYHLSRKTCKEVLQEKAANPNTAKIPVILTANKMDKNRLLELMPFNIKKVFNKPIKINLLYQTLGELLDMHFPLDETPCILEAHVNDNIVFIEIAQGFNREKIELLRFKIAELLQIYGISVPRILLMITDMELSFIDGPNIEILLNTVLESSKPKMKHVKILTASAFIREFIRGRREYSDIEVLSNLQYALDGLVAEASRDMELGERSQELISERILTAQPAGNMHESVEMRFETERKNDLDPRIAKDLKIAVVDDDFIIQELVKTTFESIESTVVPFPNGRVFLESLATQQFDVVFLDLLMPELGGFEVLQRIHAMDLDIPFIVLSAVSQRESVAKAFQMGVKSYLIKPLKPDQILKKAFEILKANF